MASADFHYTRFRDPDRPYFRLLRLSDERYGEIKCDLVEALLDDLEGMPYFAVSCRWEYGAKNKFISIGGTTLAVTSGVFTMLHYLRSNEHRSLWSDSGYFWIDTLCMDQDDKDEKSHQIDHMKGIYARATGVLIWLGESTEESDLVMEVFKDLKNETQGRLWQPDDPRWASAWNRVASSTRYRHLHPGYLAQGLETILSHSWFQRVWILQEIGNAKIAFVICGNKSASTRYFAMGPLLMGLEVSGHCRAVLDLMPSATRKKSPLRDLYTLLIKFAGADATELRDRIFVLLGLCNEPDAHKTLQDHYNQPEEEIVRAVISQIVPAFCRARILSAKLFSRYRTIETFLSHVNGFSDLILHYLLYSSATHTTIIEFVVARKEFLGLNETTMRRIAACDKKRATNISNAILDNLSPDAIRKSPDSMMAVVEGHDSLQTDPYLNSEFRGTLRTRYLLNVLSSTGEVIPVELKRDLCSPDEEFRRIFQLGPTTLGEIGEAPARWLQSLRSFSASQSSSTH